MQRSPYGGSTLGPPSLIQGSDGNFELLVPIESGLIAHLTRHNDQPNYPWTGGGQTEQFGNDAQYVALIQSDYAALPPPAPGELFPPFVPGNLECVVVSSAGSTLWHFWYDWNIRIWSNSTFPNPITAGPQGQSLGLADGVLRNRGASGKPGMVAGQQAGARSHANFHVVVPTPGNTLAHYIRDNSDAGNGTWRAITEFGTGVSVSLAASEPYPLVAVAGGDPTGLTCYQSDSSGVTWTPGGTSAAGNAGGAAGLVIEPYSPVIQ